RTTGQPAAVTVAGPDDVATFAVTFSEPVAGFAAAGVEVGGTAGGSVVGVTGSGAAYTVTVGGFARAGTVTVAARAGAAADAAGNRSAGSPASDPVAVAFPAGVVLPVPARVVGQNSTGRTAVSGAGAAVRLLDPNGAAAGTVTPFAAADAPGGLRVAAADFNRDGVADVAVGTGPGGPSHVKVLDGVTQAELFRVDPFEPAFGGGVYVAAGDIDGDGLPELVVTPDEGGGPRVLVYRGAGWGELADFLGIDDGNFRGGARAALGDVTGDGRSELVISAGFGGGPRISVYDGAALAGGGRRDHPVGDFFLFEQGLRNGAFVAAGDVDGDGRADLVGGGPGGGPRVLAVSGKLLLTTGVGGATAAPLANFFAGNPANRGGVRVAAKDLDGDARADLVAGDGAGAGSRVTAYLGKDFAGGAAPEAFALDALPGTTAGVFVG
ncbi:MAG: VCBS repeat-containing protein, partial [Gemmataceae bacterium]|nr:VCBS repeat-containing protein [Gemmataceae bacterium]